MNANADQVPSSLQRQLERLFGVNSKEARSKTRSAAGWRRTLDNLLTELYRYQVANLDTDALHDVMLRFALASAHDALKSPNFWPGYIEGIVRYALLLMGDYPDHHAKKTGRRRSSNYKLDLDRSIVFLHNSEQKKRTLFKVSELRLFNAPHPFWEVTAKFRDVHGFSASDKEFVTWFKKNYPEVYAAIF